MDMQQTVLNNLGLIATIFGAILTALGLYLTLKSREVVKPQCYFVTRQNIEKISAHGEANIKLFYKTTEVDRVYTTYIWFWNAGKLPIRREDIPANSVIRLSLSDKEHEVHILDFRILKATRDETNFKVSQFSGSSIGLDFDFLDFNDGALIELQHTGSYNSNVAFSGAILRVPTGVTPRQIFYDNSPTFDSSHPLPMTNAFIASILTVDLRSFLLLIVPAILATILIMAMVPSPVAPEAGSAIITPQQLRQIILSEIPNIPDATLENIVLRLRRSLYSITTLLIVLVGLMWSFIFMVFFLEWWRHRKPIPKALRYVLDTRTSSQRS